MHDAYIGGCAAAICHSVFRNRCAFRCRAQVVVDSDNRRTQVGW